MGDGSDPQSSTFELRVVQCYLQQRAFWGSTQSNLNQLTRKLAELEGGLTKHLVWVNWAREKSEFRLLDGDSWPVTLQTKTNELQSFSDLFASSRQFMSPLSFSTKPQMPICADPYKCIDERKRFLWSEQARVVSSKSAPIEKDRFTDSFRHDRADYYSEWAKSLRGSSSKIRVRRDMYARKAGCRYGSTWRREGYTSPENYRNRILDNRREE
ncbi:hypothetical protein BJ322DRAFT_1024512 [Thelephora terrestris]|uniref:Uncharacterized protein n=1 Tax=Thelephora terrestris TaxID=56493 RepID=A0A9P6L1X1_9AGAM|nr:hypothetical protein BJ322DRAFT_1024512 [Thelephora terrestris]